MTTIKDIARLSGYSIGTVSRVINRKQDVSEEARRIIEKIIEQENYQPNSNAKMLKQASVSNIAVLVKGTQNVFLEGILERIQETLRKYDEYVSVNFLDEFTNEVEAAVQICNERKPKGMIFLGGNLNFFRENFGQIGIPAVLVTETAKDLGFGNLSSFTTDDYEGARMAVDYLIRKGHKHIGILGGSASREKGEVGVRRFLGATDRLKESGLEFDEERQFEPSRFSMQDGYDSAVRLLKKDPDITAVFALSDTVAIGALRAFSDLGMRVPEDISLIGYDGIEHVRHTIPRLATVRQDRDTLAQKTVEDILLRTNYSREAVHGMIPFRVITGESVKDISVK